MFFTPTITTETITKKKKRKKKKQTNKTKNKKNQTKNWVTNKSVAVVPRLMALCLQQLRLMRTLPLFCITEKPASDSDKL